MRTQMIVRVEPELKRQMSHLAKTEGKNLSELIRELMLKYTKERDSQSHIDELWNRIGKQFKTRKLTEEDIELAIADVRNQND